MIYSAKERLLSTLKTFEAADIGVILLFLVFPFVFHNGYRDMTVTRFITFLVISGVSFVACYIAYFFTKRKCEGNGLQFAEKRKFNASCYLMLFFVIAAVLSSMASDFSENCFVGKDGRYIGVVFIFALFIAYTFISNFYTLKARELYFLVVASIIVSVFTLIQSFGINLFGLYSGFKNEDYIRNTFLSPLGNADTLASFLCIAFPIIAGLYCFKNNTKGINIFLIVSMFITFTCAIVSNCDSCYLGIFSGLWVICLISFGKHERLKRFITVCVVICLTFVCCWVLVRFNIITRHTSDINEILLSKFIIIPTVIFIIIHIILNRITLKAKPLRILKILYICISALLLAGLIALFVYFSFVNKSADIGSLGAIFRANKSWGNDRGVIWGLCVRAFAKLSFIKKIFGGGVDSLSLILNYYIKYNYGKDVFLSSNVFIADNAHNEFLQYLVTMGIAGLGIYIALIVTSVRNLVKNKDNCLSYVVLVAIAAYLAQSTINIMQPITTPYIFILLAFCNCLNERNIINYKG